jgi:hypothetical protein
MMVDGPLGTPTEVAWARQLLERSEREYAAMVDELMNENQQLEALARLLSEQLVDTASGRSSALGAEKESPLTTRIEDFLQSCRESRAERAEVRDLQERLRKEELEAQSLQRRLEDSLKKLGEQQRPSAALAGFEPVDATADQVRRGELAEARCSLIETRCQQTVMRLEAELLATRRELEALRSAQEGTQAKETAPAELVSHSSLENQVLHEQVFALHAQLRNERELHRRHIDLYKRYLPDLTTKLGRFPSSAGLYRLAAEMQSTMDAELTQLEQSRTQAGVH